MIMRKCHFPRGKGVNRSKKGKKSKNHTKQKGGIKLGEFFIIENIFFDK